MTDRVRWAETNLKYTFNDLGLLTQALTHRSASKQNNERLEFLGDAFLNLAIAEDLYRRRPEDTEGDLSRARASLVNKNVLAAIGRELQIDSQLLLGTGEARSGGAQRGAALADAVEALIGAVLLDGGHAAAAGLVERLFGERLGGMPDAAALKDPKTKLQEWLQGRGWSLPSYGVDSIVGKEHERSFTVVCTVKEKQLQTKGLGKSRRRAEQDAAAAMLAVLEGD